MEKLRKAIEQYGRWSELTTYMNRIEGDIHIDFSRSLENAKALLETISKEICRTKSVEVDNNINLNALLKKAFKAICYTGSTLVTQVSSALATIGQLMGELRNEIGPSSHGKSLEELKERNHKVDELTKEFLIDTTESIACFLIKTFENENQIFKHGTVESKPSYIENEDFNEYWDNVYGEFEMGNYSYTASEILFRVDYPAYIIEYKVFIEDEEGEE